MPDSLLPFQPMWPRDSDSTDLSGNLDEQFFSADDEVFNAGRARLFFPSSPTGAEAPVLGGSYSWSDEHETPGSGDDSEFSAEDQQGTCPNPQAVAPLLAAVPLTR